MNILVILLNKINLTNTLWCWLHLANKVRLNRETYGTLVLSTLCILVWITHQSTLMYCYFDQPLKWAFLELTGNDMFIQNPGPIANAKRSR